MLLNNIIQFFSNGVITKLTTTDGRDNPSASVGGTVFEYLYNPSYYSNTGTQTTSNRYNVLTVAGIVIGSDNTPPPENRLSDE